MAAMYGQFARENPALEHDLAMYRHKVFVDRLKWDLPTDGYVERDQFDRPDTVYVITRDAQQRINGCARLLPTTQPYLLAEVFPELLNGMPTPCSEDVWELSRFAAMDLNCTAGAESGPLSPITIELLHASVRCAAQFGAKRLITTSPVGIERLLKRTGLHTHRAGPPKIVHGYPLFACWIEIDQPTHQEVAPRRAAHAAH
jgi:acyl homoserine lactone synthase